MLYFIFSLMVNAFANDLEVINSLHGGMVKKTDNAVVEFVQSEEKPKVYIRDSAKNNLANQKLSINGIAKIGDKEYPLNLTYENDHYSMSPFEKLKKEKNYVLSFTISFPFPKKAENAIFVIGK